MRCLLAAVLAVALSSVARSADEPARKSRVGLPCPEFAALPGVDGKSYSLSDFKDKDVLVLAITCVECPVAQAYEARIREMVENHVAPGSKVGFIAVCVNDRDDDRLPAMKKHAEATGVRYPFVYDASQKVAAGLGAQITPEFFVFDRERKLVYAGPMDDREDRPTDNYVEPAIAAALRGKLPKVTDRPTAKRGCGIKWAARGEEK